MNSPDSLSFRTSSAHLRGYAIAKGVLSSANRIAKSLALRKMEREGLLKLLGGRPSNAFPYEADDLWFLYAQVRKRKPISILEFGSGFSTSVLAEAVSRNGKGVVISIEALEQWAKVTNAALRANNLDQVAQVLHIPAIPTESHGRQAWHHESLPTIEPDFVYLDGPPLDAERPFSVDLLEMEDRLRPDCFIIVDGRKANFNFLKLYLKKSYSFHWRRIQYNGTIERAKG